MPKMTDLSPLLLPLLMLLACSNEGEDPVDAYDTPTFAQDDNGGDLDITGRFAFEMVQSQYVDQPIGADVRQSLQTLSLVDILESADGLLSLVPAQTCIIHASTVAGVTSSQSQAYYDNVPKMPRDISINTKEIGADFLMPMQTTLLAVDLEDPANDTLPTNSSDSRIFDLDLDGHPGYTVVLEGTVGAILYSIQRHSYALNGTVFGPDTIGGYVDGHPEESILESSSPLVSTDPGITPDDTEDLNYFNLVRVDDTLSCTTLISNSEDIFTP